MNKTEPGDPHPSESAEVVQSADEAPEEAQEDIGTTLLELVLAEQAEQAVVPLPDRIDGVVVGQIAAFDDDGTPRVTFAGCPDEGFRSRFMIPLGQEDVGAEVALLFEGGNPRQPVIMGRMFKQPEASMPQRPASQTDERIEFSADKEIVLRCGKASITLTRAGKILIRGAYVLSRSSGVNRVQGGSVQIN